MPPHDLVMTAELAQSPKALLRRMRRPHPRTTNVRVIGLRLQSLSFDRPPGSRSLERPERVEVAKTWFSRRHRPTTGSNTSDVLATRSSLRLVRQGSDYQRSVGADSRFRVLLYIWIGVVLLTYPTATLVLLGFGNPPPDEYLRYLIFGFGLPGVLAVAPLTGLYGLWRRREWGRAVFIYGSLVIGVGWAIILILPISTDTDVFLRIEEILAGVFIAITAISLIGFILHLKWWRWAATFAASIMVLTCVGIPTAFSVTTAVWALPADLRQPRLLSDDGLWWWNHKARRWYPVPK